MSSERATLRRCVGDVDAFVRDMWGRQPLLHRAESGDDFGDLLSLADVDELLATTGLRAPAFRVVKDGATIPSSRYTRRATIGSKPVDDLADPGKVFALFDEGATIVLQGLQRSWAPLSRFCRDVELVLTHPVQANAYLTPPDAAGLKRHVDTHDVLVLQTHGRKRWVVTDNDGDSDCELLPGDCLYLPAGTHHAARSADDASLHITVGIHAMTWDAVERDALDVAAEQLTSPAADGGAGRQERLPAGFAADPAFPDAVASRLRDLADRVAGCNPETVADRTRRRFWAQRRPVLDGQLSQLLTVDEADDHTRLRRRPGTVATLDVDEEQATLGLGDRRIVLPARVAPALRRILEREHLAIRELDDLLDEDSRLVLARRLVREGLLMVGSG